MLETGEWRRAISAVRDLRQSKTLVWTVSPLLLTACVLLLLLHQNVLSLRAGIISLTFGLFVWVLRAATPGAAFCGSMICLLVIGSTEAPRPWPELHSGLIPLLALFVLTFVSTKMGHSRKVGSGLAESRKGRNAAQVIANLGAAGLLAALAAAPRFLGPIGQHIPVPALLLTALAEATADTVSSETGQAFGAKPFLITTMQIVPRGTNGAFSTLGTLSGIAAAAVVVCAGGWSLSLAHHVQLAVFGASIAGLFFDSLLGATLERRGLLGNDLVNFSSTLFAAFAALLLSTL